MTWLLIDVDAIGFNDGSTGHVYNMPAGVPDEGDLDILCINSDTVVTPPTGFTAAASTVSSQGSYLFYRLAAGGEGSRVSITTSGDFDTAVEWLRWQGASAFDVAAAAHVDGSEAATTPDVSLGPLAEAGELVVAFAALHNAADSTPTGVTWSAGYSAAVQGAQGAVAGLVGYSTTAGPDAEAPSATWTGRYFDRYILAAAFAPGGAIVTPNVRASAAASVSAGDTSSSTVAPAAATASTTTQPVTSTSTVQGG